MGTVTDQINTAFRDFNTDGVPSSGDYEPVKSAIRATGPVIEAAIASSAQQQAAAAAIYNILSTPVTAGGSLPYCVIAIENGKGTGSGGTQGSYRGGVAGGPSGFSWDYDLGTTGDLEDYDIVNPGISLSGTAPVLSLPGGTGAMTGVTIPTAYTGTIPVGTMFYAPSADGKFLLAWGNNAGVLASAPFGGTQIAIPLGGAIGKVFVGTATERSALSASQLVNGTHFYVTDFNPPRWYAWVTTGNADPKGNVATVDGWFGYYTPAELKNLGVDFTGILPSANVQGLTGAINDVADITTVKITGLRALALSSAAAPIVNLTWDIKGTVPNAQTISWDGKFSVTVPATARAFTPKDWGTVKQIAVIGNSLSDSTDTAGARWSQQVAAQRGVSLIPFARYSSDARMVYRTGAKPLLLTVNGGVLPAGVTSAAVTLINGVAPSNDFGVNPASFLNTGDAGITNNCSMTGWMAGRHVTVSIPNAASTSYSIVQDAGGAAVTLAGAALFVPDLSYQISKSDMVIWLGNNYFFSGVPNTYGDYTNPTMWVDLALMIAKAAGNRVILLPILPDATWTATGAGTQHDAYLAANARTEALYPQYRARDAAGRTLLQRLQASGNGSTNDNADIAAGFVPRSLRVLNSDGTSDSLHLSAAVNSGALYAGDAVVAAFVEEAWAMQALPPTVTQSSVFSLTVSAAQASNGAVSTDGLTAMVSIPKDAVVADTIAQLVRTDTMGRPSITDTTNAGAAAGTYVLANPLTRSGTRTLMRVRNPSTGATKLYLGRFTFDGTNFTQVAGTTYYAVTVPSGQATLSIPINFYAARGEYLGWTVSEVSKGMSYIAATGDSGGYYVNTGAQQPTGAFVAGTKQTGIQLQIGFDCNYALAYDDAVATMQPQIDAANATLATTTTTATQARSGNATATFGRAAITSTSTTVAAGGTFIFANAAVHSGTRHTLRFRNGSTSPQTVYLGRFAFDGTNYSQVAGTSYYPVNIPAGPGTFTILISFYMARGERLGLSVPVNVLVYDLGTGDSGGYAYTATQQPSGAFAPTSSTTGIILNVGVDVDYALAYDDELAVVQPQIDAHTASIAANTSNIATNTAGLAAISTKTLIGAGNARAYNSSGNFAPSNFYEWAAGIVNGDQVLDGKTIQAVGITFQYDATAVRVEAQLYSRPANASFINSAPGNAGDTAEWSSPVSVPVGNLGFAAGAFGSFTFVSPAGQAPLATGKSFYMLLRAFDVNGNRTVIGCGSGGAVSGAAGSLLARGFFRQTSATVGWTGIASTTASVNVTVYDFGYTANTATTVSSAPRKDQGLAIYWGRAEQVVDNTNLYTMRRIFAVPANAKRVRRVIFAHATTTGGLEITRAAIAPLASAANFAAAGATWTPLSFGSGTAKGMIPAAAGTQRNSWMASIDNPLTLLDRTDTTGAAKLVCVAAYLGGGGSPVLLGSSGNTDDYSAWASRTDFPMVMRRMAGDCVTTPANFTDTTNQIAGTCIAGLLVETDSGELLTIGYTGDSITNGAGGTTYGFGWAAILSYNKNVKFRGSCPVLLGWSGISMQGIQNIATDFYAFVKSAGLPAPNVFFSPNASPNSITPPITQAQMDAQRPMSDTIIATAVGAGSKVVSWTIIPTNPSVKAYGASDSYRVAYNNADRTQAGLHRGLVLADMDTVMSGVTDANGQVNIIVGDTTDGIHPNDAGHAIMAATGERALDLTLPAAGYAIGGVAV